MKRRRMLFMALLLAFTMVFTSTFAFAAPSPADPEEQPAVTDQIDVTAEEPGAASEGDVIPSQDVTTLDEEVPAALEEEQMPEMTLDENAVPETEGVQSAEGQVKGGEKSLMAGGDSEMVAPTMNYTDSQFTTTKVIGTSGSSAYQVYPIRVETSGKLYVDVQAGSSNSQYTNVRLGTFDEPTSTFYSQGSYALLSKGEIDTAVGGIDVLPGTYYVGVQSDAYAEVQVVPYVYSYATRYLAPGRTMLTSGYNGTSGSLKDSAAMYQIKPAQDGYIAVALKEYGYDASSGYVTLLNSGKKMVADRLWYYSASKTSYVTFGVKKGVTYYLKVDGCQGSYNEDYVYGIQYKLYGAPVRANTAKKKSINLKRKGSAVAAVLPANGSSKTNWYKFKVKKTRATQIRIDASNMKSGKTTVTVYRGKKKVATRTVSNGYINTYKVFYGKKNKAKKGTYYIKISGNARANGKYTVRYLK